MDKAQKRVAKKSLVAIGALSGIAALLLAIGLVIYAIFPTSFFTIYGDSMNPYFKNGNVGILLESSHLKKGDIVFFDRPPGWTKKDNNDVFVKRVVAIPGDTLSYNGTQLLVDGKIVFDFQADHYTCSHKAPYSHVLSSSELFAMGDNYSNSLDSRYMFCNGGENFYINTNTVLKSGRVLLKV